MFLCRSAGSTAVLNSAAKYRKYYCNLSIEVNLYRLYRKEDGVVETHLLTPEAVGSEGVGWGKRVTLLPVTTARVMPCPWCP